MKRVRFGEFLTPNKRPYTLGPEEDANLVGMRLYGEGPFHREFKLASKIQKKSHFVVRTGDVIYNKLFAWKGTFGVIPDAFDGMFVSDKFPTYALDSSKVDLDYLRWYFRHPGLWEQARSMSTGSAALSKFTLNPPKFLDLTIPMRSIDEQRAVVRRLNTTERHTRAIQEARHTSQADAKALMQSFVNRVATDVGQLGTLGDVLTEKPRNGWSVRCDNSDGGTPVLTLSAVTGFNFDSSAFKRTSEPTDPGAHYWLHESDLLITRSNTPELVGHVAIYNGSPSPCIYPDLIMKVPLDHNRADLRFVWHWLQGPVARSFITTQAKGTSPTMKKISQKTVMAIPFPTALSLAEQVSLRERLDLILGDRTRLDALFAESDRILGGVIPAAVAEAFHGEPIEAGK